MGLVTGLLTLPLAPIRGTIWIAEKVAAEAARQLGDEETTRRELAELEAAYELGELTDEEYVEREEELLARLELAQEAGDATRGAEGEQDG